MEAQIRYIYIYAICFLKSKIFKFIGTRYTMK